MYLTLFCNCVVGEHSYLVLNCLFCMPQNCKCYDESDFLSSLCGAMNIMLHFDVSYAFVESSSMLRGHQSASGCTGLL